MAAKVREEVTEGRARESEHSHIDGVHEQYVAEIQHATSWKSHKRECEGVRERGAGSEAQEKTRRWTSPNATQDAKQQHAQRCEAQKLGLGARTPYHNLHRRTRSSDTQCTRKKA
ncbi:hypothetical protein TRVL_09124 [Trypanosoma vivax]|nr:hypothetical protein TRVL_09124 [Trypanosoma vivax]